MPHETAARAQPLPYTRRQASLQAPTLAALAGIRHAFFTRDGGVSDGIYASLNGGPGSEDAPANVAENRDRMAATLGRAAGSVPHRLSDRLARRRDDRAAVERAGTPPRRCHRDPHARPRDRSDHRRLRPGAARRPAGRRHRRRPCRLARRRDRRARSNDRGDGAVRCRPCPHGGGARTDDSPAELRGRTGIRRPLHGRGRQPTGVSSSPRRGRTTRCSIFPATSPRDLRAPASRAWRMSAIAPMPIPRGSSATAGRPTGRSATTGVTSMP